MRNVNIRDLNDIKFVQYFVCPRCLVSTKQPHQPATCRKHQRTVSRDYGGSDPAFLNYVAQVHPTWIVL